MMKSRLQSIILRTALLLIAVLGTALQTHAYNFEVDGIYYNIISDTDVEVTYKASNEKIYSGAVTIPSQVTHDGKSYTVTRIGLAAFSECSDLTSVTMPITIKTIGYSFYGCTGLERVIIPDSVEGIGNWAFAQCTNLNEVVIGESVAVLGDFAFKDCSNLTKLTVGKSVTYMWCVFNGCNKIKELTWNPKYCERSDCLSTDSLEHLTVGLDVERLPGDLDLDECNALKKLTWNARNCLSANMYKRNITEVILGEEVETLPEDFVRGSKITQITIPTSVKSIGRDAFYRCYSLAKVYISDLSAWMNIDFDTYIPVDDPEGAKLNGGNRDYDDDDEDDEEDPGPASAFCRANPLCYGADLFINNVKKATIVVPDDVTAIKQGVFSGCKTIKTIKIGNHVTSIGSVSFDHCPNLTTVEIGDAITTIPGYAFYGTPCFSLTIGRSVDSIGVSAFSDYSRTVRIYDLNKWCEIDFADINSNPLYNGAYDYNSWGLVDPGVNGDPDPDWYEGEYKDEGYWGTSKLLLYWSKKQGFRTVENLDSLTIPHRIKDYTFAGCNSLKTIDTGNIISSIGDHAFYGCNSLTSVKLTGDVDSIAQWAFGRCDLLESVTLSAPLRIIGECAFNRNQSMRDITIPGSVTRIDKDAFWFKKMIYNYGPFVRNVHTTDLKAWCNIDFVNIYSNPLSYSPYRDMNLHFYLNENEIIDLVVPNGVTTIKKYAFCALTSITSITIPKTVTTIGDEAFGNNVFGGDYYTPLVRVTSHSTVPPTLYNANCFKSSTYDDATLEVPAESIEAYRNAVGWEKFKNITSLSPQADPNDVNLDGEVNVADVNALINIILSGSGSGSGGDVNDDGEVTVADVNALINYILNN